MQIVRTVSDLRAVVAGWRADGDTVSVVPTMGALHAGHLSLVAAARAACDRVIVTLFVNPRQFDRPEDIASYPRTEDRDRGTLGPLGVDLLFAPGDDEPVITPVARDAPVATARIARIHLRSNGATVSTGRITSCRPIRWRRAGRLGRRVSVIRRSASVTRRRASRATSAAMTRATTVPMTRSDVRMEHSHSSSPPPPGRARTVTAPG